MTKKGIDVSGSQGVINWKEAAKAVDFAIIKAGGSNAGFYTADRFAENYKGATAAGVPLGAYYYVGENFKTAADGKADAQRFLAILKGKRFAYPVFVDVEETRPADKAGVTDATLAFCETVEKAGYYVGIYSSAVSGFVDRLDASRLKKFDFWVADYRASTIEAGKPALACGMWQYSETGSVAGITGKVDLDIAFKDYPAIIKVKGLNGYKATASPTKTAQKDASKEKTTPKANSPKKGNSTPKTAYRTHTVKKGDTLTAIASKYKTTWRTLAVLNNLDNPDLLKVGQKLKIPTTSAQASAHAPKVGDVVTFTGARHYPASTSNAMSVAKPGLAAVTHIAPNAPHPYHLIRIAGKGSTVWGWVDACDIQSK